MLCGQVGTICVSLGLPLSERYESAIREDKKGTAGAHKSRARRAARSRRAAATRIAALALSTLPALRYREDSINVACLATDSAKERSVGTEGWMPWGRYGIVCVRPFG